MTKYFVYAVTGDLTREQSYAFVIDDKAAEFAPEGFRPAIMTYTGIMVEADSPKEANEVYNRPTEYGGDYMMADEPVEMVLKRQVYDAKRRMLPELKDALRALVQASSKSSAQILSVRLAQQLIDLNASMSRLARLVQQTRVSTPELSVEAIYDRIKKSYAERLFNEFKYTTDPDRQDG